MKQEKDSDTNWQPSLDLHEQLSKIKGPFVEAAASVSSEASGSLPFPREGGRGQWDDTKLVVGTSSGVHVCHPEAPLLGTYIAYWVLRQLEVNIQPLSQPRDMMDIVAIQQPKGWQAGLLGSSHPSLWPGSISLVSAHARTSHEGCECHCCVHLCQRLRSDAKLGSLSCAQNFLQAGFHHGSLRPLSHSAGQRQSPQSTFPAVSAPGHPAPHALSIQKVFPAG